MKVFFCRNCGFFHAWKNEVSGKIHPGEYEGFSANSIRKLINSNRMNRIYPCPVCSGKGCISFRGSTVVYEITKRKTGSLLRK